MADRIVLTGLRCYGYHGVFPEEKREGQEFLVDVTCWADLRPAAESDDLSLTLNYAELAELAHQVLTGPPRDLIETVAAEVAERAMAQFPLLHAVEVTVHKPQAPIPLNFGDVAVVARRSRKNMGSARD
ncbi:dihydroneopterin aldolase [Corynebacterium lowii]|uniref:7,8-dihydroneopterin aldolase n=1 Tax=Corynebacterium lowii TaxID=1544413 RepID=A0A0Q0UEB7_9CORY|nr:dihydroneopterin aldolase [Corynebacterium lowii]KQB86190.1 putative dihydroneopterin aldolase [Corynebacterium lowii]MDP9852664.1 dihydroneopterin aldolase [Corynebacterium lowii]